MLLSNQANADDLHVDVKHRINRIENVQEAYEIAAGLLASGITLQTEASEALKNADYYDAHEKIEKSIADYQQVSDLTTVLLGHPKWGELTPMERMQTEKLKEEVAGKMGLAEQLRDDINKNWQGQPAR